MSLHFLAENYDLWLEEVLVCWPSGGCRRISVDHCFLLCTDKTWCYVGMEELKINWHEWDLDTLRFEIQGDQAVQGELARYGVLKLVENPLMRAVSPCYWELWAIGIQTMKPLSCKSTILSSHYRIFNLWPYCLPLEWWGIFIRCFLVGGTLLSSWSAIVDGVFVSRAWLSRLLI